MQTEETIIHKNALANPNSGANIQLSMIRKLTNPFNSPRAAIRLNETAKLPTRIIIRNSIGLSRVSNESSVCTFIEGHVNFSLDTSTNSSETSMNVFLNSPVKVFVDPFSYSIVPVNG